MVQHKVYTLYRGTEGGGGAEERRGKRVEGGKGEASCDVPKGIL